MRMPLHIAILRTAVTLVAGAAILIATGCGEDDSPPAAPVATATPDAVVTARAQADLRIKFLEERADSDPLDTFGLNSLAIEFLQRSRETGDVTQLRRAEDVLNRSLAIRLADNYEAIALLGQLRVTQHDFARGAELASAAIGQRPDVAFAYGVLGDASMGLGLYEEATAAFNTMNELEPDVSTYSREALIAQVYGKYEEAALHWQRALDVADAYGVPEHTAWVHAQIGHLRFILGDLDGALAAYEASESALPGYVHAQAGIGRVSAARGEYADAIERYTTATNVIPLPEYVIALGDIYAANGESARAQDQYDLVSAIDSLYEANGVSLDLQVALFNADHGQIDADSLARARAAYESGPSIQAADVHAWSLHAAGDDTAARVAIAAALRTGSRDPLILFHAGMIEARLGNETEARAYLEAVRQKSPMFSVLHSAEARETLDQLSGSATR